MSASNKILQAAAGNAAGEATYVEDVFSTYLYEGTGSARTITNGIDLSGEGGLVWFKSRDSAYYHWLFDTERGAGASLKTNSTDAQNPTLPNSLSSFNSDGFSVVSLNGINNSGGDICSWTFRKAPKFFDVVTYTGNNEVGQYVDHNLGVTPGCIIIKSLDSTGPWFVWHRGLSSTSHALRLNATDAESVDSNYEIGINASDTQIYIDTGSDINYSNYNYVAYLFAHNDGDGEFGETADQDIIKCGSYTATGDDDIDLGFEPQFLLHKRSSTTAEWYVEDFMRGMSKSGGGYLSPNSSAAEGNWTSDITSANSNGFHNGLWSSGTVIYIAIRRGPMKTPESGTEVFATLFPDGSSTSPTFVSNFPVDFATSRVRNTTNTWNSATRLTGTEYLEFNTTDAGAPYGLFTFDFQDGWAKMNLGSFGNNWYSYVFRRAPGFFDVVAYTGTGSARTVTHNLGVEPELIIVKDRSTANTNWAVYSNAQPQPYGLLLNSTAAATASGLWNSTAATATNFTVSGDIDVNNVNDNFIAYLFATVPGVSKVGSYTGTTTAQTIDCGFTTGARFVLIKRTSGAGGWILYDSERGISAGNDPYLLLNTTDAEDGGDNDVGPHSSGFIVNATTDGINNPGADGAEYIFLAIA